MDSSKTLIILASAPSNNKIEADVLRRYDPDLLRYRGVPKGLLPISGKPAITWWWNFAKSLFSNVYILSNAYNYKHFERWASGVNFPKENILNSGLSTGVLSDIAFAHRVKNIQNDLIITSPELFCDFDMIPKGFSDRFFKASNFVLYTQLQKPFAFGMGLGLLENLDDYNEKNLRSSAREQFDYSQWQNQLDLYIQGESAAYIENFEDIPLFEYVDPDISLSSYVDNWMSCLDHKLKGQCNQARFQTEPLHVKAFARVGLMGNPSDGFYGKTMSLLISNFWAEVTLIPNNPACKELEAITILPNPVSDPHNFSSIECLVGVSEIDGYETGDRLLQACCKVFYRHCSNNQIEINTSQGFKMMFETNIPRQVGLAGSSAIVTALWKMLTMFYGVSENQIPLEIQASLVLKVEQDELGIAAGLQDRVIQAFGGLVYMDFDRHQMEQYGHGKYTKLDVTSLPQLWLAYIADPDDSGKVHSTVKKRFLDGDKEIIQTMQKFASFTQQARQSLEVRNHKKFAELMTANFDLRRKTYGDSVIGARNLRMIELAREHQCAAKFPGSGGAVVGMWKGIDSSSMQSDLLRLRRALEREGFVFVELVPMIYDSQS